MTFLSWCAPRLEDFFDSPSMPDIPFLHFALPVFVDSPVSASVQKRFSRLTPRLAPRIFGCGILLMMCRYFSFLIENAASIQPLAGILTVEVEGVALCS